VGKEDLVVVRGEFNNGYMCDSPHWVPILGPGLGCMMFFLGSVRFKRAMCPSSGEQADYICKFVSQLGVVRVKVKVPIGVSPLSENHY